MFVTLLKRFINAVILLWVISVIAFWLSKQAPGDEVMDYLTLDDARYNINSNPIELRHAYQQIAEQRQLDLPAFYLSISRGGYPDTVDQILPYDDRATIKAWIDESNNGNGSLTLYRQLYSSLVMACGNERNGVGANHICTEIDRAIKTKDLNKVHETLIQLNGSFSDSTHTDTSLSNQLSIALYSTEALLKNSKEKTLLSGMPEYKWHGTRNQYHQWMKGLLLQKPMTSLVDGLNAWAKIYDALKWTLLLNGFAFLLVIFLGVLIGIWSGLHAGRPAERIVSWFLFILFALPSFWLGTLFIYFLASGEWLSVFPASGLGPYHNATSCIEKGGILFSHFILPVTCLSLGSLAYVSRQMKQSVLHQFTQPYVKSLRSQGIAEKTIIRKHVIRNSLFPIITIIGGSIPALLSGSLIIEVIYSIPGMGRLMYSSLLARDWPVVFPILMIGALLTIISYALTDIIYKWVDPRVKTI